MSSTTIMGYLLIFLTMGICLLVVGSILVLPFVEWMGASIGPAFREFMHIVAACFGCFVGLLIAIPFNNEIIYLIFVVIFAILFGSYLIFRWTQRFCVWLWNKIPGANWQKILIAISILLIVLAGIVFLSGLIF